MLLLELHTDENMERVFASAGEIFNHARINPGKIKYDAEARTVSIKLIRFPIVSESLLRQTVHAEKGQPAEVLVYDVASCVVRGNGAQDIEYELLFGLMMKGQTLYACSAAEDQGVPCFEVSIRVGQLHFLLRDC